MGRKKQIFFYLPSANLVTRQILSLPSARSQGARQRFFFKKNKKPFAECLTAGHSAKANGRWPPSRRPPLPTAKFCRVPGTRQIFFCRRPIFAERPALGKGKFLPTAKVCRVSGTRQRKICRRPIFAECLWVRLSAKIAFAECPTESARQSFLYSANQPCPVVEELKFLIAYYCE